MMQAKLFTGDVPEVSTYAYHEHRQRGRHLEHPVHRGRLRRAARFVNACAGLGARTCSDLGCGDGGLLSLVTFEAWGYDWTPANAEGWAQRGVTAEALDVFGADRDRVRFGDVSVVTEVLEHLADPFDVVAWIGAHSRFLVASSPWTEFPGNADESHAWAFDKDGYAALIESGGYRILQHDEVNQFQVVWAAR